MPENKLRPNILIWDTNLGVEHAARLAQDCNVRYFTSWASKGFPKYLDFVPGKGMIDKSIYFFDDIDWADLVMFPDSGNGDLVDFLKKVSNKPVYGAGIGEELELQRWNAIEVMKELKIPYPPSKLVVGVDELEDYLKTIRKKVFVKFDIFRGEQETFGIKPIERYSEALKLRLAHLRIDFGPFANEIPFVVQEELEGVESGFDLIFNGNEFCGPYQYGYEIKGTGCYLGKLVPTFNDLPEPIRESAEKIKPYLKKNDYRGAISNEGIIGKDKKMKIIDWTCRFPYPLSAIYTVNFKNYSEIVEKVAKKESVKFDIQAPYVGIVAFESEIANTQWLDLSFNPKFKNRIKLRVGAFKNNTYYAIPEFSSVVSIIGLGNSPEEVVKDIKNIFEESKLDAFMLDKTAPGGFYFVWDIIEKSKEYGVPF